MDELAHRGLLFEDAQHLMVDIETTDHRQRAGAQLVESVAVGDAAVELGAVAHLRPGVQQTLHGLLRMAVVGVVDGDVQGEVVGIDAQLGQLVGGDQQVQRQLLVTQVEADHLGQELLGAFGQGQLDRALNEMLVIQALPVVTALAGQQLAVEHHMILVRQAFAQLFEIGLDQRLEARLVPALQQAVEPGAIDQLGRCHATQKMQGVGLAGKVAAGRAGTAAVQIGLVLQADLLGMAGEPVAEPGRIGRQVAGQPRSRFQLLIQIRRSAVARGFAVRLFEQREVQVLRRSRRHQRNRSDIGGQTSGQLHNSHARQ